MCKYGEGCYRKNPEHFVAFSHPWLVEEPAVKKPKEGGMIELIGRHAELSGWPDAWHEGDYGSGVMPWTRKELEMMEAMGQVTFLLFCFVWS